MGLPSQNPEDKPKCYYHFGAYEHVQGDCDTCFWGYACMKDTEACSGCAYSDLSLEQRAPGSVCAACQKHRRMCDPLTTGATDE